MQITQVQTFVVGNPWKNWLFVKVHTDEGVSGIGEATSGFSTKPNEAKVRELSRFVIGEDPLQPETLWQSSPSGESRAGLQTGRDAAACYPYRSENFMNFFNAGWEGRFFDADREACA